jgi:hypothetical protein
MLQADNHCIKIFEKKILEQELQLDLKRLFQKAR